jgi:hypothetical protein
VRHAHLTERKEQPVGLAFWTDVSIIWLSFLSFILGIVPLVLLYFAIRGMMIVNRRLPRYFKLGQYYSGMVRDLTYRYSAKVTGPLVSAYGEANRVQTVARNLAPRSSPHEGEHKE